MGIKVIGAAAAVVALVIPVSASAVKPTQSDQKNAAQECRFERGTTDATKTAFRIKYGTNKNGKNAFGKCVSQNARDEAEERQEAHTNAAKECKAERALADADFMADHEGKTFEQFYGTNENGSNAYGKCVSTKAKAEKDEMDAEDKENAEQIKQAAKDCMTERKADLETFRQTYGTNRNKRNAFGKCVSKKVHEAQQQD
jgi:hypothetical protein